MMKKLFLLSLTLFFGVSQFGLAQTSFKRTFWEVKLSGKSVYLVALDAITSVSFQTYIVDNVMEVTETTIDTRGCALARFYFIEKRETSEIAPEITEKVAPAIELAKKTKETLENLSHLQDPLETQKVIKNYPATTHAKTIEYRLASKAEVQRIYDSASKAFKEGLASTYEPDKK